MKTDRLEFFSDGVFAIAITLLVIEIRLPAGWSGATPLAPVLLHLWPSYLAFAVSFFVVGAIWINHHGMFELIVRADKTFLLLNLLQLMAIAFIPFPTAVLAESIHAGSGMPVAAALYGATLVCVGVFVNLMWWYAVRHDLLKEGIAREQVRSVTRRFLVGPIAYAAGSALALVLPWGALAVFVGLNIFYLWPRWKRS